MPTATDERIAATQPCPAFVAGPVLFELLNDPMTRLVMTADRVEYRELEAVLQRAHARLLPVR